MTFQSIDLFDYLQQIGLIGHPPHKPDDITLERLSEISHLPLSLIEFYDKQFSNIKQSCPEKLDTSSQKLMPAAICRQYQCIPFHHDDQLLVACTNPYDLDMRKAVEAHLDSPQYCLAPSIRIKQLIMTYFHEFTHVEELSSKKIDSFIDHILRHGYQIFASDIHIQLQETTFEYKYRRFGQFQNTIVCSTSMAEPFKNRLLIRSHVPFDGLNQPTDCSLTLLDSPRFTVRISYIPTQSGYSIVIRIIRPLLNLDFSTLTSASDLAIVNQYLLSCKDTILLYGATGTGKSTLFYHLLKELVQYKKRPISIEDPVENIIPGVFQISLDKTSSTYAQHIAQILRQDPNAVGISELRTEAAVKGLATTKMSGILSIATLHALSPLDCLVKLLKMGYPQHELFNQNILTIATRLVPIQCSFCRSTYSPSTFEMNQLFAFTELKVPKVLHKANGCFHCHHTGIADTAPLIFLSDLKRDTLFRWVNDPAWQMNAHQLLVTPYKTALNASLYQKLIQGDISFATFTQQCLS